MQVLPYCNLSCFLTSSCNNFVSLSTEKYYIFYQFKKVLYIYIYIFNKNLAIMYSHENRGWPHYFLWPPLLPPPLSRPWPNGISHAYTLFHLRVHIVRPSVYKCIGERWNEQSGIQTIEREKKRKEKRRRKKEKEGRKEKARVDSKLLH